MSATSAHASDSAEDSASWLSRHGSGSSPNMALLAAHKAVVSRLHSSHQELEQCTRECHALATQVQSLRSALARSNAEYKALSEKLEGGEHQQRSGPSIAQRFYAAAAEQQRMPAPQSHSRCVALMKRGRARASVVLQWMKQRAVLNTLLMLCAFTSLGMICMAPLATVSKSPWMAVLRNPVWHLPAHTPWCAALDTIGPDTGHVWCRWQQSALNALPAWMMQWTSAQLGQPGTVYPHTAPISSAPLLSSLYVSLALAAVVAMCGAQAALWACSRQRSRARQSIDDTETSRCKRWLSRPSRWLLFLPRLGWAAARSAGGLVLLQTWLASILTGAVIAFTHAHLCADSGWSWDAALAWAATRAVLCWNAGMVMFHHSIFG